MKVIIVDDEPKAIQLIETYLKSFSDFELVATFRNGLKALEFLNTNPMDLIYLDINMPHLNGLSLSKMISRQTAVVFTTAYSEYAVESYEVNAIDYLLKPVSFERFAQSITKIMSLQQNSDPAGKVKPQTPRTLFIKSGLNLCQVEIEQIEYLKKDGNYIHYYVSGKKIMARQSVKEALEALPAHFIQIHKTYIINFKKLDLIKPHEVIIGEAKLPIGPQYKSNLFQKINNPEF